MAESPSKINFLGTLFMLLFLVVAPIGSWYYLKQGENFRKQQIEELMPKGSFEIEKLPFITDAQKDSLDGELMLISVIGENKPDTALARQFKELIKQFGDRPDFNIFQISYNDKVAGFLKNRNRQKNSWDASFTPEQLKKIGINPPEKMLPPYWALVDIHQQIRHYYNHTEKEKMVVHTAMILPLEKRAKINVKRDEEK